MDYERQKESSERRGLGSRWVRREAAMNGNQKAQNWIIKANQTIVIKEVHNPAFCDSGISFNGGALFIGWEALNTLAEVLEPYYRQ